MENREILNKLIEAYKIMFGEHYEKYMLSEKFSKNQFILSPEAQILYNLILKKFNNESM